MGSIILKHCASHVIIKNILAALKRIDDGALIMSDILSSRKPFETRSNEEWQERITQAYGETVKFISIEQPDMAVDWRTRGRKERLVTIRCDKCGITRNVKMITIRDRIRKNNLTSHCPNCEQIARKRQKAERKEKARLYFIHIRKYEQLALPLCECGQIVKKNGMLCDNCRAIHKREADRRKENARRLKTKERDKDISLQGLFERDNGICYLCGLPCNWNDCRTDDNGNFIVGRTYPTIEHVLPLCKGGTDTWNNIKLAHHGCNSAKGRRILGEHAPLSSEKGT